ncbi:DUF6266 family protein [Pedobacter sp. MC2016-14]|uniref:DUF6266 family protein n=1 Tax=Pedobacter sp. MC2016-14 TaxID=2897327 RepID=UPI001E477B2F|nr:DUF6266 family protein [Pedobacter sp. MC2016-14]MCD0489789.1 DUF6266 family protein [Pedobacter sp. MC2016-14]
MGKYIKGILGSFSGKIGTVIGASWRGIDYMRSLSKKRTSPFNQAELAIQSRFKIMTTFLRSIADLISKGFQNVADQTPMNKAVSVNLKNAVTGVAPDFTVDYAKLKFSQGTLMTAGANLVVTAIAGKKVKFTWPDALKVKGSSDPTDKFILLLYSATKDAFVRLYDGGLREDLDCEMIVPSSFVGNLVHTYIIFETADGKKVSDTQYGGAVTIVA